MAFSRAPKRGSGRGPMTPLSSADSPVDLDERPTAALPLAQLVRLSLYWLGLSSIFAGITAILGGRLEFEHLVPAGSEGSALFQMTAFGSLIAAIVQPTVGSLSDYTTSRWGRRKPYIVVGSVLDVVFLVGIASSSTVLTIAAFMTLLQISANVAQGPFQGYVPDLVPERQVGLASALVGMFQVLGNVMGAVVAALAVATGQYAVATVALGVIEVLTMLSVALGVREGRAAKARAGRSWAASRARGMGADVLHERSFLWLVGSRLFVLIGSLMLLQLGVFYVVRSLGLAEKSDAGQVYLMVSGLVAVMVLLTVLPAARASDRFGRKPVIYAACGVGALALSIIAVAPSVPIVLVGAGLLGVSTGSFLAGRLGAHDRHHPEGVLRAIHGDQQRRHGLGRRLRDGLRRDPDGSRGRLGAPRLRAARRDVAGGRLLRGGRDPPAAGPRAAPPRDRGGRPRGESGIGRRRSVARRAVPALVRPPGRRSCGRPRAAGRPPGPEPGRHPRVGHSATCGRSP